MIGPHIPSSAPALSQGILENKECFSFDVLDLGIFLYVLFPSLHSSFTGIPVGFVHRLTVSEAAGS